ncbi:MAG: hypothetical protein FWG03_08425 [Clostridiales bacterium]|nr:hypothetical protein [Clostridiales bacterium]
MEFSIEDIHRIREENYEKTKNMTTEELLAFTKKKAAPALKRIEEIRAKKSQAS